MRALFTISVALVALFVVDAIGFGGKLRNTGWSDLRFQAHRLNDEWKGSMRPPAQKSASRGGEFSATMHINEDGTVVVATGSPDIGGSRASMAIMAAETLGIDYDKVRPIVADTASVGYAHLTGGSRVTFATGLAVVDTTKQIIKELCVRAAKMWGVDPDGVVWEDGCAKPASSNVGDFKPLALKEIAAKRGQTGGPIVASAAVNPTTVAPGFATQFCDVEVDPETGKVTILCDSSPLRMLDAPSTRAMSRVRSKAA
jgi:CO/xanthine dehydrogenase Mo-binding subunit